MRKDFDRQSDTLHMSCKKQSDAPNRLEQETAEYFNNMSEEEAKAERELESAIAGASANIDVDAEE